MHQHLLARKQIGLFLLGVLVAATCLPLRWALQRARLAGYERLDERITAILDRGDVRQARRLVSEAMAACRRLGSVPPSVYAAAALLYGPDGLNDPVTSARYMEAAMEVGLSVADKPALRALYAADLAALRRWSDLVELYSSYPQETLFSDEQRLLVRAYQELGLTRRAYEAVLRALTCPLDRQASLALWQVREKLASQQGLLDCWAGVDGERLSAEAIWTLADCELRRVTAGPEAAIRAAERLLWRFSDQPELLARVHALLYVLLRDSNRLSAARTAVHSACALATEAPCGELWTELLEWECSRKQPDVNVLSELISASCQAGVAARRGVLERALRCYTLRSLVTHRPLDRRTVEAVLRVLGGTSTANCLVDAVGAIMAEGGGQQDEAVEEVYRILCSLPVQAAGSWRFRLACWLAKRGDYGRALTLMDAQGADLDDPEQLLVVARWCRAAGDWDRQVRFAMRAHEGAQEPGVRLRAELELGLAEIHAGNYAEAERILGRALREAIFASAQDRALAQDIRVALALAVAGQGKVRSALGLLEEWIEEGGQGSARGHFLYALLLYVDAQRTYRYEPARVPGGKANVYADRARNRWLRVAETATAVLDRFRGELEPEELDQLRVAAARAFVMLGEHERALALLEGVGRSSSPWAFEAALERANCLWLLGRRDEAQACLAKLSGWRRSASTGWNGKPQVISLASSTLRRLF